MNIFLEDEEEEKKNIFLEDEKPKKRKNIFLEDEKPKQANLFLDEEAKPAESTAPIPLLEFHEQYAKPTGNFILDKLQYLDRPRNALAVAAKEAFRGGSAAEGVRRGLRGEDYASTRHLLSDEFQRENPVMSALLGFTGDVATDPLTWLGAPMAKGAVKGAKAAGRKIVPGASRLLDNDLAKAFNIYTGDLKKLKKLQDKYRNLAAFQKHEQVRKAKFWDKELKALAEKLDVTPEDLKKQIIASVETPGKLHLSDDFSMPTRFTEDMGYSVPPQAPGPIMKQAQKIRDANRRMLAIERKAGIPTGKLDDYIHHAITPEGEKQVAREKIKQIFRINKARHGATEHRKLEGTIAEINKERPGFFSEDPVVAHTIRGVMHTDAMAAANFLDDAGRKLAGTGGDFVETSIPSLKGKKFNREVARELERVHQIIVNPPELKRFRDYYDKAQNWWKMWSLGARPAYHARNFVGNTWNNYLGDVHNPVVYGQAAKLQRMAQKGHFQGEIAGVNARKLYEEAGKRGIFNKGQYGGDIMTEIMDEMENSLMKTRARDFITPSTNNKILRTGFAVGHAMEDNARIAHFIDKVKKGYSYDDAAQSVKKYLFDYSDLSDVEKWIKRPIPFYTWSRKNIPLQIESMITKPHKFQKINIARDQIQADVDMPEAENVPEFVRDLGPVYYGNTPEGEPKAATLMNYLPAMDPQRLLKPMELITPMISPFIKEIPEQLANYDTFRREEISKYKGETADFLGVAMPVRLVHLMRNLVMVNEIDRFNPFGMFGENYLDEETQERVRTRSYGMEESVGVGPFEVGAARESRTDLPFEDRAYQYLAGIRPYIIDEEFQKALRNFQLRKDVNELITLLKKAKGREEERRAKEIEKVLKGMIYGEEEAVDMVDED